MDNSIAAHGSWAAWNNFTEVSLSLKDFRGALPLIKGLGRSFRAPDIFRVNPKERRVQFDYGTHVDEFRDGELLLAGGKQKIPDGRTLFRKTNFETWTNEHAMYFFGYAWANYIGYPFILPQFELLHFHASKTGTTFRIRFPENFHTHCQEQIFYFNSQGLLVRHDYHADFAGPLFFAAHCTEDYQSYNGLQIACERKVHPRLGPFSLPFYGIYARLAIV